MKYKKKTKQEMKDLRRNMLIRLGIVVILTLIVFSSLMIFTDKLPEIEGPVENMTFRRHETFFYDYEVFMFHSDATATQVVPDMKRIPVGVVTDTWNLDFGSVPEGSSSTRTMDLANIGTTKAKVMFRAYGTIEPYVSFDKDNFILEPGEETSVKISFKPSMGDAGYYEGGIDRIVKVPRYGFLDILW